MSTSRLIPSGVSSYAQAKITANTRPKPIRTIMVFMTHSGVPKLSNNNCNTCATSQEVTR